MVKGLEKVAQDKETKDNKKSLKLEGGLIEIASIKDNNIIDTSNQDEEWEEVDDILANVVEFPIDDAQNQKDYT